MVLRYGHYCQTSRALRNSDFSPIRVNIKSVEIHRVVKGRIHLKLKFRESCLRSQGRPGTFEYIELLADYNTRTTLPRGNVVFHLNRLSCLNQEHALYVARFVNPLLRRK